MKQLPADNRKKSQNLSISKKDHICQTLKGWSIFIPMVGLEFKGIYFPAKLDVTASRNLYNSYLSEKTHTFPSGWFKSVELLVIGSWTKRKKNLTESWKGCTRKWDKADMRIWWIFFLHIVVVLFDQGTLKGKEKGSASVHMDFKAKSAREIFIAFWHS